MNNSAQTQKRGKGRPDGSTSFIRVSLAGLNDLIGPKGSVVVSKKWLDSIGIAVEEVEKSFIRAEQEPTEEQTKIEFAITPFSDDEDEDSND